MLTKIHLTIESVCPIQGVSFFGNGKYEIQFDESATNEQRIAAQSIVDSWVEPTEPRLVYALDFLDRFSETTQLAVVAAASQNPAIRLWYDRLLANGSVDLESPRLIAGLNAMRDAGLMTQNEIDIALT
jgi:hypothetical protein